MRLPGVIGQGARFTGPGPEHSRLRPVTAAAVGASLARAFEATQDDDQKTELEQAAR